MSQMPAPSHPHSRRSIYPIRIAVVYYSRFGAVEALAEKIAEGAKEVSGIEALLIRVDDWQIGEPVPGPATDGGSRQRAAMLGKLISADAIIVGSPGYFGSMAAPVKRLFEECATSARPPVTDRTRPWRQYLFRNKVGGAFTATATPHGGNEQTLQSILTMLMHLGMIVVTPGQQQPILENDAAPYGPTAITGPSGDRVPEEAVLESARTFGRYVAEVTLWLRLGQTRWPNPTRLDESPSPGRNLVPDEVLDLVRSQ